MDDYIKTLDLELKIIEMQRLIKKFNKDVSETNTKNINILKYEIIPIIISVLIMSKKRNKLVTSLVVGEITVAYLINSLLYFKDKVGVIRDSFGSKYDTVYGYLLEQLDKINHTKYINRYYYDNVNNEELSEDQKKFNMVVEKQKKIKNKKYKKTHQYVTKNDALQIIFDEIDCYYDIYDLPLINVSDNDWNNLFDTLYDFLKENKIEKKFYDIASSLVRYTLAGSLIKKDRPISIHDFIDNISNLTYNYLDLDSTYKLKQNIKDKKSKTPIYDFAKYKLKKVNKKC